MMMHNADESITEDMNEINRNIAAYIRLRGHVDYQGFMRKSFKKSCASASCSESMTSSQAAADVSFINTSSQGPSELSLVVAQDEHSDEEMLSDVEDVYQGDGVDINDVNNNLARFRQSDKESTARPARTLPLSMPATPDKVLEAVHLALDELKHQDIEEYLEYSTKFIQMHLGHNLRLDLNVYKLLFNCTNPAIIQKLFDQGLIDPKQASHIGCLYERNYLFSAIDLTISEEHSYAFEILMSLAVLVYKSNTTRNRRNIYTCLNRDFTAFVTSDFYEANRKSAAVKCFLRSLVLTGTISLAGLSQFFGKYEPIDTSMDSDMDSDSIEVFSSSEDNSNSDDERPRNRRAQNLEHNRGAQHAGRQTVGQILNCIANTTQDLCNMYPLSLKNQCRIVIKGMMPHFSLRHVRRLRVLPTELQEFVLYNDEVDRVVKLSKRLTTVSPPSSA